MIVPGEADGALYAGGDPGVLFESRDGGATWELNRALWEHPTRPKWQPGAGGLCLHSIVTWPGEPDRLAVGDLGRRRVADRRRRRHVAQRQRGPRRRATCRRTCREDEIGLCVHRLHRAPTRPERMFMQFHGGVYRSDDAGESWTRHRARPAVGLRLPARDRPRRPRQRVRDPAVADTDRVTPEGRVRVYETRDAGASWTPRGDGLPSAHAYLTILREAFDWIGEGEALELYFGATSGTVFGSGDAGASWFDGAAHLPPVPRRRLADLRLVDRDLDA